MEHRDALVARPQFAQPEPRCCSCRPSSPRAASTKAPVQIDAGAPRVQASRSLQSRIASETHVQSQPDRTRTQGRNLIPSGHTEGIAESKGIRPYVADIANIE